MMRVPKWVWGALLLLGVAALIAWLWLSKKKAPEKAPEQEGAALSDGVGPPIGERETRPISGFVEPFSRGIHLKVRP